MRTGKEEVGWGCGGGAEGFNGGLFKDRIRERSCWFCWWLASTFFVRDFIFSRSVAIVDGSKLTGGEVVRCRFLDGASFSRSRSSEKFGGVVFDEIVGDSIERTVRGFGSQSIGNVVGLASLEKISIVRGNSSYWLIDDLKDS